MAEDLTLQERLAETLAFSGNTKGAVRIYVALIKKYARMRDIERAEAIREKMLHTDSMAVSEIVETAGIIENARSQAIPSYLRKNWAKLNDHFSETETEALYYSMQERIFNPCEYIYTQGDRNDSLYFISEGRANSFFLKGREECVLQTLGPGSVAGHDSFFLISVCTSSLVALTPSRINVLTSDSLKRITDVHTGLISKLKSYCLGLKKPHELLKQKGLARRSNTRFKINGIIFFSVINLEGKKITNELRGEMADVSLGGLSFYIKTSDEDQARKLLNKRLHMKFRIPFLKDGSRAERTGLIRGVIANMFHDYSLHIKFDELLDSKIEQVLIREAEAC